MHRRLDWVRAAQKSCTTDTCCTQSSYKYLYCEINLSHAAQSVIYDSLSSSHIHFNASHIHFNEMHCRPACAHVTLAHCLIWLNFRAFPYSSLISSTLDALFINSLWMNITAAQKRSIYWICMSTPTLIWINSATQFHYTPSFQSSAMTRASTDSLSLRLSRCIASNRIIAKCLLS